MLRNVSTVTFFAVHWRRLITAGLLMAFSASTVASGFYKWVDENGVVHFGDRVPDTATKREREIVNPYGMTIETLAAQKTPAQIAEEKRLRAEQERLAEEQRKSDERDRRLLQTYPSVEDIIEVRDRRVLTVDARSQILRQSLEKLQTKWNNLEEDAQPYAGYSDDEDAKPLPENLAQNIETTEEAIAAHMLRLKELREEKKEIETYFSEDIKRLKELKGVKTEDDAADKTGEVSSQSEVTVAAETDVSP